MNRTCFLLTAGLLCHAALQAQGFAPQQAQSLAAGRGGGVVAQTLPRVETGKPFSATVTTQTVQTLFDGTKVSQTTTSVQYRDTEGRVRTENAQPAGAASEQKIITIRDPVAGMSYRLDQARKTAVGSPLAGSPQAVAAAGGGRRGGGGGGGGGAVMLPRVAEGTIGSVPSDSLLTPARATANPQAYADGYQAATAVMRSNPNDLVEDLGTLTVNGVPARGTRITTVVPVGAIGNDREFKSVSERWFSPDLNLLVKSVSTDPRFGTTTYELTNISRQSPDPSLFQVPADYSMPLNVVVRDNR